MLKILVITVVTLITSQVFADPYGMYSGFISMSPDASKGIPNGRKVPISIALKQTDTEITPTNPTNAFQGEKKVEGSFVLDSECGSFGFSSSEYDLETGKLTLQYARLGSTGSPSAIINIRIECKLLNTGICEGTVSGVNGQLGTISIKQMSTQVVPLQVVPKYVGAWRGKITYSDAADIVLLKTELPSLGNATSAEFDFFLSDGDDTVTNPDFYEIATTPRKAGSDYEGGSAFVDERIPYSTVYIDYLRGIAKLTAASPSAGFSGTETLIVHFNQDANGNDNGTISGTMSNASTVEGTFDAQKVQ